MISESSFRIGLKMQPTAADKEKTMELTVRKIVNSSEAEIIDGCGRRVARSKLAFLFISDEAPIETAIEIAERFGNYFGIVIYKDYPAWLPASEVATDWAS